MLSQKKISRAVAAVAAILAAPSFATPIAFDFTGNVQSRNLFDATTGIGSTDPSSVGLDMSARIVIETDAFAAGSVSTFPTWRNLFSGTGFSDSWSATLSIGGSPVVVAPYELNQSYLQVDDSGGVFSCGPGCTSAVNDSVTLAVRSDHAGAFGVTNSSVLWFNAFEPVDLTGATPSTYTNLDDPFDLNSLLTIALPNLSLTYGSSTFDCQALNLCFFQSSDTTRFNVTSVSRSIVGASEPVGVPEPGALSLLAMGLLAVGLARRRRVAG